jgi:hypothetical protein
MRSLPSPRARRARRVSRRLALAALAVCALAREAAADDAPPEAIRSPGAAVGGLVAISAGTVAWGAGLGVLLAGGSAHDYGGESSAGGFTALLGGGVIAAGVPVALYGALRTKPRSPALAVTGIPITALGAGLLVAGSIVLGAESLWSSTISMGGTATTSGPGLNRLAPGIAVTAAGAATSALGLTLYLVGNRRASAAPSASTQEPAGQAPSVSLGPRGMTVGWRF